ncbi:OapC/ArvC family zinc-ribbon domain-containing protein [Halorubrum vacuolatum]
MLSGCPDCGGNKFQFKPRGRTEPDDPAGRTEPDDPADRSGDQDDQAESVSTGPVSQESTPTKPNAGGTESDIPKRKQPDNRSTAQQSAERTEARSTASGRSTRNKGVSEDVPAREPESTPEATSDAQREEPTAQGTDPTVRESDSTARESDSTARESDPSTHRSTDSATDTEQVGGREHEDTAQASARTDVVTPDELDRASQPVATQDTDDPDADSGERPDIEELRDELNEQFESIRIVSPGKYELNLMELYDRQEYIISLQEDGRYVIEMPDAWGIDGE